MYVIKSMNGRGGYITPPSKTSVYTKDINKARIFINKKEAMEYHDFELELVLDFELELNRSK